MTEPTKAVTNQLQEGKSYSERASWVMALAVVAIAVSGVEIQLVSRHLPSMR